MAHRPIPTELYCFRARCEYDVDGDTISVVLDRGFDDYSERRIRLLGPNAPETKGKTKAEGLAASAYTRAWLGELGGDGWPLVVQTEKPDVFGRCLATVWRVSDGACLNEDLLSSGHAVPWVRD